MLTRRRRCVAAAAALARSSASRSVPRSAAAGERKPQKNVDTGALLARVQAMRCVRPPGPKLAAAGATPSPRSGASTVVFRAESARRVCSVFCRGPLAGSAGRRWTAPRPGRRRRQAGRRRRAPGPRPLPGGFSSGNPEQPRTGPRGRLPPLHRAERPPAGRGGSVSGRRQQQMRGLLLGLLVCRRRQADSPSRMMTAVEERPRASLARRAAAGFDLTTTSLLAESSSA